MKFKKSNQLFVIGISLLSILLLLLPTGFENPSQTNQTLREKAEILSVNNEDLHSLSVVTVGTQDLIMRISSGQFKDDTLTAHNVLMGQKKIDKIFKAGDKVLAILQLNTEKNKILSARADDHYRIRIELILFALFALFLIIFAGLTGFKALLSFVFTALSIWKILVPLLLRGYNPLFISLLILSLTTAVIIILINGFSKKGIVALIGSLSGISITGLLAVLFAYFFQIPGTVKDFSEALLYTGFTHIKLTDIFISGIFISAAGAVMDVAMDISASQNEIVLKKPDIQCKELITSGFHIAYPIIGTMTTTLLFAYSGGFIFIFMSFMAKGTPVITIFNTNYIAAEILNTLVGSFGLVLVAPVTAIVGGYIFTKKKQFTT